MSAITPLHTATWIRIHRATVTIALLAVALATTLTLLVVRLAAGPTTATTTGQVSTGQGSTGQVEPPLQQINEGCMVARAGVPC
jgi:hypothetical protein